MKEIKDEINWIPFEIKPEIHTPYHHYLVWFRGFYGKVKHGAITIGVYDRDNQDWNILESNNKRYCVPTHYAEINPPKDTSADSELDYLNTGSSTIDIYCKKCNNFIAISKQDFDTLIITIDDINHKPDCEFFRQNKETK